MPLLLLNINMIKRESRIGQPRELNWGPQDWLPMVKTSISSSAVTGKYHKSLATTLVTFYFPETVQMFSNPN